MVKNEYKRIAKDTKIKETKAKKKKKEKSDPVTRTNIRNNRSFSRSTLPLRGYSRKGLFYLTHYVNLH